ncbi:MAG TPA: response regulator [Anaerolineaceae bacterium]|nr:response regulator [Anaerolineaceae bacterium]
MSEQKPTILIVEDDLDIADMLNAYFKVQEYDVVTVNWGEDAVRTCQAAPPDMVILDIRLPDIDGFEVARRLRANRKTQELPIIFLTERRERLDRLRGLELRAEDYITKPFDIQELRLKVRNTLMRARRGNLTNPVTSLAEGALLDERLKQCLKQADWTILVISLLNVANFREAYGFVASDDLLRAVAVMLQDALREQGNGDDFLGQLTGADFLIVSKSGPAIAPLRDRIQKRLEQSFDYFYRDQDRSTHSFKSQRLGLRIGELPSTQSQARELDQLKLEVERLYRQGIH